MEQKPHHSQKRRLIIRFMVRVVKYSVAEVSERCADDGDHSEDHPADQQTDAVQADRQSSDDPKKGVFHHLLYFSNSTISLQAVTRLPIPTPIHLPRW